MSVGSMKPSVSLLTVTNRGQAHMRLAVQQALKQSYLEEGLLEVVIVHNIKPEQQNELWYRDARGFLKEMEDSSEHPPNFSIKAMLHIREEGDTLGDLRNRGVEQCSSEFVMVWDDDDLQLARV